MPVSEIEKYVLTAEENAAIKAVVVGSMLEALLKGDTNPVEAEINRHLGTGLRKIMSLQDELRKGIDEVRKENNND